MLGNNDRGRPIGATGYPSAQIRVAGLRAYGRRGTFGQVRENRRDELSIRNLKNTAFAAFTGFQCSKAKLSAPAVALQKWNSQRSSRPILPVDRAAPRPQQSCRKSVLGDIDRVVVVGVHLASETRSTTLLLLSLATNAEELWEPVLAVVHVYRHGKSPPRLDRSRCLPSPWPKSRSRPARRRIKSLGTCEEGWSARYGTLVRRPPRPSSRRQTSQRPRWTSGSRHAGMTMAGGHH